MTAPIPQPPTLPLLGNLRDMDPVTPVQALMGLARTYGPIYRLDMPTQRLVVVSAQALVHELSDERRFTKHVHSVIRELRDLAGDGLFTAYNDEPSWGIAHRVLVPAFGPAGLRAMFDPMLDVAEQLALRWERFGDGAVLDVADQMTRLTLDTIALCAFDYRFNSFYQDDPHPFIEAMVSGLHEAGQRSRRPPVVKRLMWSSNRRYQADIAKMHATADRLIAERRADPRASERDDLLTRMLTAVDPVTGETLSDENIRYQMVTFLVAGHETTSGLLSFALHFLLANPAAMARARAAVDAVLGDERPRLEHLPRLRYVEQVLMEALRLWPTAPIYGLKATEDTTLGGQYAITRDDVVFVLIPSLHRDPAVWGPDAEDFRPERFDRDAEAALPPDAWKPFGTGARACIGRPFAMQEAVLVLSLLLQRFDLRYADPTYALTVSETLTLKPADLKIHARRRPPPARSGTTAPSAPARATPAPAPAAPATGPASAPLLVLFGSNTGTSEAFARRIAADAAAHGFAARLAPLDAHADALPRTGALVVVTASYEGQPPDNARRFVDAIEAAPPGACAGVRYAVFGCGNRQWARTWQAVPTRVDAALAAAGATRLRPRGESDAAADLFGDFDAWYAGLWADLTGVPATDAAPGLRVDLLADDRAATLGLRDLRAARVVTNRELVDLSSPYGRSKRHLELTLPEGTTWRTGDYLAVLPRNPPANVARALRRFGLSPDAQVVVRGADALPDRPIAAAELLSGYVELAQPATRAQVGALAAATRCPPERDALQALAGDAWAREVLERRVSVLDLLERSPACPLSFEAFLAMLPPLRVRQYSIASSPLADPRTCALTVAVVEGPALSGQGRFAGVASSGLAAAAPGDLLTVGVRPSGPHLHPPADPTVPMVLIGAGSGIAPLRAFLQERALQAGAGRAVGASLLFFGCDHPDVDLLYRDELAAWQAAGIVDVRPAFTFAPDGDVAFVQHRLWRDRAAMSALWRAGAIVYVCGDGQRMAPAVRETLARIHAEEAGIPLDAATRWLEAERAAGRVVEDVFA